MLVFVLLLVNDFQTSCRNAHIPIYFCFLIKTVSPQTRNAYACELKPLQ